MSLRSIQNVVVGGNRQDGEDGYFYTEPLPNPSAGELDPFLLLHHHGPVTLPAANRGLPFGPHPHRGFETATFILKGSLTHKDSNGFSSEIFDGGVQWMTAGRGLIHNEFASKKFMEEGGPIEMIQLWVNLPARLKMTAPNYVGVQKDQTVLSEHDGGRIKMRVFSGQVNGVKGPIQTLTQISSALLELEEGSLVEIPTMAKDSVLFYLLGGELEVNDRRIEARSLVIFKRETGLLRIKALKGANLLVGFGEPIREKYAWHGPFVMSNETEILQAMRDFQMGKMGFYID